MISRYLNTPVFKLFNGLDSRTRLLFHLYIHKQRSVNVYFSTHPCLLKLCQLIKAI